MNDWENMGGCSELEGPGRSVRLFCVENLPPEPTDGTTVTWQLDIIEEKGYEVKNDSSR